MSMFCFTFEPTKTRRELGHFKQKRRLQNWRSSPCGDSKWIISIVNLL